MKNILTVTAPASSHDLITLVMLKSELNITNNASDTRLSEIITQASGVVEDLTGRVWVSEGVDQKFFFNYWENIPSLILARRPIKSITTVTENGVTLVEDTDYAVDARKGMLYRISYGGFLSGIIGAPSVVVDYVGGYDLSGSPPDVLPGGLVRATLILAKSYWFSGTRDPSIRSETTFEIDSVTYQSPADAMKSVMDILDVYSDPGWA